MIGLRKQRDKHNTDVAFLTVVSTTVVFTLVVSTFLFSFFQTDKFTYRNSIATVTSRNNVSTKIVEVLDENNVSDITKYVASKDYYSWVGNRWVPPPGVPHFSPKEIRLLFQSENTIWWGDSTSRQDYQTMYSMMNAGDLNNIPRQELERNINKGKGRGQNIFHCPHRTSPKAEFFTDLGQVAGTNCSNQQESSVSSSSSSSNGIGKFDLGGGGACFKQVLSDLRNNTSLFQREYSVMILSLGIWEVARPWDCRTANSTETPSYFLVELLNALKLVSSPSLYIIWKTHGPSESETNDKGKKSLALIETAENWFSAHKEPLLHMGLSDFGFVISNANRTFGQDRISGDLKPHWGLDARTLSTQMAAHLVYMKKKDDTP